MMITRDISEVVARALSPLFTILRFSLIDTNDPPKFPDSALLIVPIHNGIRYSEMK